MRKQRNKLRILSLYFALAMVLTALPQGTASADSGSVETHYLVFASDRHSNATAISTAMSGFSSLTEYAGLIGDMADETDAYNSSTIAGEIWEMLPNVAIDILYGDHDDEVTDDAEVMNEDSGLMYIGYNSDSSIAYYVYGIAESDMKSSSKASTSAENFKSWIDGIQDYSIPIFVLCHMPMHQRRSDNKGGYIWSQALNYAATGNENGNKIIRDIIFFHGHNHTVDKTEYYYKPGDTVTMENGSIDISTVIQFSYLTAGYLDANKHATQVTITNTDISFNRSGNELGSQTRVPRQDEHGEESERQDTTGITNPTKLPETVSVSSSVSTGNSTICTGQVLTIEYTAGGSQTYTIAIDNENIAAVDMTSFTGTSGTAQAIMVIAKSAGTAKVTINRGNTVKATVTVIVQEHSFTNYSNNGNCTKIASCEHGCGATETVAVPHTVEIDAAVAATCTHTGLTEGSHCSVCKTIITPQEVLPVVEHVYGMPSYNWAEDGCACQAIVACSNCTDTITEMGSVTSMTKVPATYTEMGTTVYTALFMDSNFIPQVKEIVDIPVLAHSITITKQPESCSVKVGDSAEFSVNADNDGEDKLNYLWKYYNGDTLKWESADVLSPSCDTNTLTIVNVMMPLNGYRIKCIISAQNGDIIETDEVSITVDGWKTGDADMNGIIDIIDCNLIRRSAVGLIDLEGVQLTIADVNGDGKINVIDVNYIRRYIAGLISQIPITVSKDGNTPSSGGNIVLPDSPVI